MLGIVLGILALVFVITVAAQIPGGGGKWFGVAFLPGLIVVVIGSVASYRWARAKGHRDLGICLLIGIVVGFVAGLGAAVAYVLVGLSSMTW